VDLHNQYIEYDDDESPAAGSAALGKRTRAKESPKARVNFFEVFSEFKRFYTVIENDMILKIRSRTKTDGWKNLVVHLLTTLTHNPQDEMAQLNDNSIHTYNEGDIQILDKIIELEKQELANQKPPAPAIKKEKPEKGAKKAKATKTETQKPGSRRSTRVAKNKKSQEH